MFSFLVWNWLYELMHLEFTSFIWRHRLLRHIDWTWSATITRMMMKGLSLLWWHILGRAFTHAKSASSLRDAGWRRLVQHLILILLAAKSMKSLSHHAIKVPWILGCRSSIIIHWPYLLIWFLLTLERSPHWTFFIYILRQHRWEWYHGRWIHVIRMIELASVHEWINVGLLIRLRKIESIFHRRVKLHRVLTCLESNRVRLKLGVVFFGGSHTLHQLILFLEQPLDLWILLLQTNEVNQ